jgi:hypothetical protein
MASNLSYLIPVLRLEIGDINPASYRYTDDWLDNALVGAVVALQRWWNDKYLVDVTRTVVSRNPASSFSYAEPPVIQTSDETPVVLMATYIIKEGSLEANAWNIGTWRDAEYYVSNIDGGRIRDAGLQRTWDRLLLYMKPPQKRLNAGARDSFDFGADETT